MNAHNPFVRKYKWYLFSYLGISTLFVVLQTINEKYAGEMATCMEKTTQMLRGIITIHHIIFQFFSTLIFLEYTGISRASRTVFQDWQYGLQMLFNYIIGTLLIAPIITIVMFWWAVGGCDNLELTIWMKIYYWTLLGILQLPWVLLVVYTIYSQGLYFPDFIAECNRYSKRRRIETKALASLAKRQLTRETYAEYCSEVHPTRFSRFGYFDLFFLTHFTERMPTPDLVEFLNENCRVCKLCLESFGTREKVVRTQRCGHLFHARCLMAHIFPKTTCPDCTQSVREDLKTQVLKDRESQLPLSRHIFGPLGVIPPKNMSSMRTTPQNVVQRPVVLAVETFYYAAAPTKCN